MTIVYLLRKSDVNEEELSQVSEYRAVQAAGLGSVEELLVTEPEGEGGQVLVSHLPDQRLLLSTHLVHMDVDETKRSILDSAFLTKYAQDALERVSIKS